MSKLQLIILLSNKTLRNEYVVFTKSTRIQIAVLFWPQSYFNLETAQTQENELKNSCIVIHWTVIKKRKTTTDMSNYNE